MPASNQYPLSKADYKGFSITQVTKYTAHAEYPAQVEFGPVIFKDKSVPKLKKKIDAWCLGLPEVTKPSKVLIQKEKKPLRKKVGYNSKPNITSVDIVQNTQPNITVTCTENNTTVALGRKGTIKHLTITLILAGIEDSEIITKVCKAFPKSKFSENHLVWYRSTLTRDDIISHRHAPKQSKRYKAWKALNTSN